MTLPTAARAWAESLLGGAVVHDEPLTGGVASAMSLLRTADGCEVVLRRMLEDPWRAHAEAMLTRERDVQVLLAGRLPVPTPLGVDASGAEAGDPALLMTRLPGAVDLHEPRPEALAALLLRVHAVVPEVWPREYQSWATEAKRRVPPWATDPGLFDAAFALLRAPGPSYPPRLLHRDFHPGNVLWDDGEVSGLVDWVETSTGPADLDVAHCCSHLATLHGVEAALRFRQAYVDQGGGLTEGWRFWQVLDLVAFLPGPDGREAGAVPSAQEAVWRAAGRDDLTVDVARARREALLRDALAR